MSNPIMKALPTIVCLLLLLSLTACHRGDKSQENGVESHSTLARGSFDTHSAKKEPCLVYYPGRTIRYSDKFRDKNDLHLAAAASIGLKHGPKDRADAKKMKKDLREIKTNKNYVVDELTHSVPYLVPKAAAELDTIGVGFADILKRNDLPHYRFRVTSVLRTQDDIRRLQRSGNVNSVSNSAHCYGTTFDIAYLHYDKVTDTLDSVPEDNLKLVLGQVLLNEQRKGRIYVKYEWKQCCFHITCR